jgi:hypothetical protein
MNWFAFETHRAGAQSVQARTGCDKCDTHGISKEIFI